MAEPTGPGGTGRRAMLLLAAALILAGCLPALGFYHPRGLALVVAGSALALIAWATPHGWQWAASEWGRRALTAVGPGGLLLVAVGAALQPQPSVFAAPFGLVALLALTLALLAPPADLPVAALVGGLLVWAPGAALLQVPLLFVSRPEMLAALAVGWLLVLLCGLLALTGWRARPAVGQGLLAALFVAGLLLRAGAILASPEPVIDVHAWLQQAPAGLLQGRNPYAMNLASPYGTARARRYRIQDPPDPDPPTYPPGILLAMLPSAAGFDPRWLICLAWLATAWLTARRAPPEERLGAGLLLVLPSACFTAEQAWFDILLAGGLLAALAAPERSAGALLGWVLTVKQSALFLLPAALARWRSSRFWAVAGVTVLLLVAPFLLWGPTDFWHDVVAGHLAMGVRENALCLPAWGMRRFGWAPPSWLLLPLAALIAGWAAWRGRGTVAGTLVAGGLGLLAFNLLNRRAQFNYYEVVAVLLIAGAVAGERRDEDSVGAT